MRRLFLLLAAFSLCANQTFASEDSAVKVEKNVGSGQVTVSVTPLWVKEATVSFTGTLENMESSRPLPCVVDVTEPLPDALVFSQSDKYKPWRYDYHFTYQIGLRSPQQTSDYIYELPFPTGQTYRVNQGYMGTFTHNKGTDSEYALDFDMPEGSTVCAAREGVVVGVREDSDEGGPSAQFKTSSNYVVVRHEDGTYGNYVHLKKNGAKVKLGAQVDKGDPVGLSGATGQASKPHLHFDVYRIQEDGTRQTIPVKFRQGDNFTYLQEAASYGH